MKKPAKLLAILTALCTVLTCFGTAPVAATETATTNLVTNGSFEVLNVEAEASNMQDDPVDWPTYNDGTNASTHIMAMNSTNRPAKHGDYFMRVAAAAKGYQRSVPLEGGKEYSLSVWVRSSFSIVDAVSPGIITLSFNGTKNSAGLLYERGTAITYHFKNSLSGWTEFKTVFTPTTGSTSCTLLIRTGNSQSFGDGDYFELDDLVIREVTDADNHVYDGDFDTVGVRADSSNTFAKYQRWVPNDTHAVPKSYGTVTPAEGSEETSNYMEIQSGSTVSGSGSYLGYGNIGTQVGLEAGRVYKFSFSAKAPAGERMYGVMLKTINSSLNTIDGGTQTPYFTVDESEAGKWKDHAIYFVAREDQEDVSNHTMALTLQLFVNQADTTVWFDNVSLTTVSESKVYFTDESEVVMEDREKVTRVAAFYVPEADGASSAILMTAIYKVTDAGTTLNDVVTVKEIASTAGEAVFDVLDITIPEDTAMESYYARAFLWNSISGLIPVAEAVQMQ